MEMLLGGLVLFLGVHSVAIVSPAWRDEMAAKWGELPWKGVYAVVSIIGFALIVQGYGATRPDPTVLYVSPGWLRHVSLLLMVPVFPLLLAAYLPGRIKSSTRHPMLVATKLWAVSHLLANGTAADVVLFGAFLAWAVADRISLKSRPARPIPGAPPSRMNDAIAVIGGLLLYGAFVMGLHAALIGIAPI
jgi:uncharacterized membrane protein